MLCICTMSKKYAEHTKLTKNDDGPVNVFLSELFDKIGYDTIDLITV